MKERKHVFYLLNIIIPLLTGIIIYWMSGENIVAFDWLKMQEIPHVKSNIIHPFIRNYGLDMLWAYALFFAIHFLWANKSASIWRVFICAAVFSSVMEFLQLTSFVKGTFDVLDIIGEILAELVAVFIIKNFKEGNGNG